MTFLLRSIGTGPFRCLGVEFRPAVFLFKNLGEALARIDSVERASADGLHCAGGTEKQLKRGTVAQVEGLPGSTTSLEAMNRTASVNYSVLSSPRLFPHSRIANASTPSGIGL